MEAVILLVLVACSGSPAPRAGAPTHVRPQSGRTWTVDCAGGADFATIRDAIDNASGGDTVEVAPCTYYGSLNLGGHSVHLLGTAGAASTIVVGAPGEPVLTVENGEDQRTIVEGLTLQGGGSATEPAVKADFSSLTLRDSVVTGGQGLDVIYARSGLLLVERTSFHDNTAAEGYGIFVRRGEVIVKDSSFDCGAGVTTGARIEHGMMLVDGFTTNCPGATSVFFEHSAGRVERSLLVGSLEDDAEGEAVTVEGSVLVSGAQAWSATMTFRNVVFGGPMSLSSSAVTADSCIFATASDCAIASGGSSLAISYSDFYGNTQNVCGGGDPVGASGNVSVDPGFVDAAALDYHLSTGSAAIDAGTTDASRLDVDGSRNDMGAYGGRINLGGGW